MQARIEGRTRRMVIGQHGEMKLPEARRRAGAILARIKAGENPAEEARQAARSPLFKAFAEEYLRRCDPSWKPSGRKTVRIYLKARILPTFARMKLDEIGPEDVAAWFDASDPDTPGAANRALDILRAMMYRAEQWGWRERDTNPYLGIRKNPRRQIARFLDAGELQRLGRALDTHGTKWPGPVAIIRLLALTGCRRAEILNLRWRDIGAEALHLPDSKTGPRSVPLGEAARAQINALPGPRRDDWFVFPRYAQGRGLDRLVKCWHSVCDEARLGRLRLHDLRHTLASQAVMSGENLPLVGQLLGHQRHRTTAGYAHLSDGHLVEAVERVGGIIATAMTASISTT